jgi:hypothetical protein
MLLFKLQSENKIRLDLSYRVVRGMSLTSIVNGTAGEKQWIEATKNGRYPARQ